MRSSQRTAVGWHTEVVWGHNRMVVWGHNRMMVWGIVRGCCVSPHANDQSGEIGMHMDELCQRRIWHTAAVAKPYSQWQLHLGRRARTIRQYTVRERFMAGPARHHPWGLGLGRTWEPNSPASCSSRSVSRFPHSLTQVT